MRAAPHPAKWFSAQSMAMILLTATLLLNITAPKLGFRIDSVPVYVLDLLKLAFLYFAFQLRPRKVSPRQAKPAYFIIPLVILILLTELFNTLEYGAPDTSIYSIGQVLPAILMCVGVARCVRSEGDMVRLLKIFCVGIIFSSLVTAMVSYVATRGLVINWLLSNPFLNSTEFVDQVYQREDTIRGTSLIGVSNMTGAFLNIMLPTMVVLFRVSKASPIWRALAVGAIGIAIFAIMATYSRSAYVGLALVLFAIIFLGRFRGKWLIVSLVGALGVSVVMIGIDSDYFYFDRIERRAAATIDDPYAARGESERIDSYLLAGDYIAKDPKLLIAGEGVYTAGRAIPVIDRPDHSVFGRALFAYGLAASLAYCAIMLAALYTAFKTMLLIRDRRTLLYELSCAMTASLLASLPWFLFTHAIVSNPRATSFYFAFVGLVYAVNRMAWIEATRGRAVRRPEPMPEVPPAAPPADRPMAAMEEYLARPGR